MKKQSDDAFLGSKASHGNSSIDVPRKAGTGIWGISHETDVYHASSDASLFSSSLPVLSHEKCMLASMFKVSLVLSHSNEKCFTNVVNFNPEICVQSVDDDLPNPNDIDPKHEFEDPIEEAKLNTIGNLLPDDDELLAGLMDDFDLNGLPSQLEDLEDCDLFGSGGGMELDFESQENFGLGLSKLNIADNTGPNGQFSLPNGMGTVAGEHPYGEHPSRTLFVRNINSNVEDSELRSMFEQYGAIRTLYTACKHRGFVMISYYDIRSARTAMRALQNKPLRRRKLDIHFSIPKDNPSEKDVNQGTLVVFNLDPSVSNDDLRQIFGAYGEVKEIRETPHKRHHKFIEFYDVRASEAALRALNRSDIAGKRIKLEPSRPGGARRNLMQQLSQDLDQDETRTFRQQIGSPLSNSPPGNWVQIGSPVESSSLHPFSKSPGLGAFSPINSNHLSGLASILPRHISNTPKMAPIGKDQGRVNHAKQIFTDSSLTQGSSYHNHQSFSENQFSTSAGLASSLGDSNSKPSSIGTLSGPQFLWGSPTPYSDHANSLTWPTPSVGQPFSSSGQGQGSAYINPRSSLLGSHHHHVGSAPSGGPLDRQFGYFSGSPDLSFINPVGQGNRVFSLGHSIGNYANLGLHAHPGAGVGLPGNVSENGSPSYRMMSLPGQNPIFFSNGSFPGLGAVTSEGLLERSRSRRVESSMNQMDSKKQYQLDLDKIIGGEDIRTTLMIKNIPNKYTSKMLLAAIDENHLGTYDFLYLPIDFKNKCNVGYAFINMVSPKHIIPFYEAFNGKKWEKFNSEKVASLAYARIQGKAALVTHFQNSSLMNEDKRCRPILFHSEGQEISDQETFISSNLNVCIRQPDGSYLGDSLDSPKGNLAEKS